MAFQDISYQKHADQFAQELTDKKRIARSETWLKTDTADYWRHARMYEAADVLTADPEDKWLTIGDGRLGLDAIRLGDKGVRDVLASDISDTLLKKSKEEGHIAKYAVENAESLSFSG